MGVVNLLTYGKLFLTFSIVREVNTLWEDDNFIVVKSFNDALKRANFNPAKVRRDLIRAGHIVPIDGEFTPLKWIDNETGRARVLQIKFENNPPNSYSN